MASNSELIEGLISQIDTYIASDKCTTNNKVRVEKFHEALQLLKLAKSSSPSIDCMFDRILVELGVTESRKRKRATIEDVSDEDDEELLRSTKKQNTDASPPPQPRLTIRIPPRTPSPMLLTLPTTTPKTTRVPLRAAPIRRRSSAPSPPPTPCLRSLSPKTPNVELFDDAYTSSTPLSDPTPSSYRIITEAMHSPPIAPVPARANSLPISARPPSYSCTPPKFRRSLTAVPKPEVPKQGPIPSPTITAPSVALFIPAPSAPSPSSSPSPKAKKTSRSKRTATAKSAATAPTRRSARGLKQSAPQ